VGNSDQCDQNNNENINKSPYQALNYQPEGTPYPYIYIPVAHFSKVGAQVKWDHQKKALDVTTDYYWLESRLHSYSRALEASRFAYDEISKSISTEETKNKVRFNGIMDENTFIFDGKYWSPVEHGDHTTIADSFTVGKYYNFSDLGGVQMQVYLMVENDRGEQVYFNKSVFEDV